MAKAMETVECSTKGLHGEPSGQVLHLWLKQVGQLWQGELMFYRDMLEKYMSQQVITQ